MRWPQILAKLKAYVNQVAFGQGAVPIPGPPGPQGPPGENAIPGVVYTGPWEIDRDYMAGEIASCDDGKSYVARYDNTTGAYPPNSPSNWAFWGVSGAPGPQGEPPSEEMLIALIEAAAKQMKITVPFIPDYSAIKTVAVISEDGGAWTANHDGYVYMETGAKSADSGWLRPNVWINDIRVDWNLHSSTLSTEHRIRASVLLPIGKGDTIKVEVRRNDGSLVPDSFYVITRFIPPRGLVLPTGDRGPQGIKGEKGDPGPSGVVSLEEGGEALAFRSDGYLFRISRAVNMNVASGARQSLLQGFTFPANIERMANTVASEWDITSNGALIFRALDGYVALTIDVRLSGTIAGVGPGSLGEFSIELRRPVGGVDTVAAERGVIGMGTLNSKSICFESYTHTITDPFITDGVRVELNNTSASAITITGVTVLIKGVQH